MPFDWMDYPIPQHLLDRHAKAREQMHADEVSVRAGLFRRLGYGRDHALHRVLGNLEWGYELAGKNPLSKAEVRRIVGAVYDR